MNSDYSGLPRVSQPHEIWQMDEDGIRRMIPTLIKPLWTISRKGKIIQSQQVSCKNVSLKVYWTSTYIPLDPNISYSYMGKNHQLRWLDVHVLMEKSQVLLKSHILQGYHGLIPILEGELPTFPKKWIDSRADAGRSVASMRNAWGWEPLSSPGAL